MTVERRVGRVGRGEPALKDPTEPVLDRSLAGRREDEAAAEAAAAAAAFVACTIIAVPSYRASR